MTIDQIIKVDIAISEAMAIDGGYDTILIIGPLPKTPGLYDKNLAAYAAFTQSFSFVA